MQIRKQAISEFQVLARPGFSCLESLVNVEHREVNVGSLRRDRSIRVSRMCVGSLWMEHFFWAVWCLLATCFNLKSCAQRVQRGSIKYCEVICKGLLSNKAHALPWKWNTWRNRFLFTQSFLKCVEFSLVQLMKCDELFLPIDCSKWTFGFYIMVCLLDYCKSSSICW